MTIKLERLDEFRWLIPKTGRMRVPGLIFSNSNMIEDIRNDQSLVQVTNVATLPGIVNYSLAMPDIHWGYGFPIGGVAAFDTDDGIVSPGGVGYDINCGCRLMTTLLLASEIRPLLKRMITGLFKDIPSGVGSKGLIHLSRSDEAEVAVKGAQWAIKRGFGSLEDLQTTEDRGCMQGADPSILSDRAVKRGLDQLGTLGSGNHFLEIQVVDRIYNEETAKAYRLFEGQVTILIHTGSRGFGYQICDDFIKQMTKQATKDIPELPDRQLVYAMLKSDLAKNYIAAMACAANYAWANRQILMGMTEEILMRELSIGPKDLGMNLLYDVCHNIAKMEKHTVNGHETTVCVHRKGATRALPPGHSLLPEIYRDTGQPVLVPGDMGTASYILSGTKGAREHSFCSSCHGAGRILSRNQAIKKAKGRSIDLEMEDIGILVCAKGKRTLKEEMPEAYKDISQVIDVVCGAGLANKVARLRPLAVMKG